MVEIITTSYMAPSKEVIDIAIEYVRECRVLVGVTDTLYGVFADPFRDECVEKVYRVKERKEKPIPLLASNLDAILEHAVVRDNVVEDLLEKIWPGPVTVILNIHKNSLISKSVHLGTYKVGFRIPASPLPRKIAENVGGLVTGTSANISGLKPARNINEAYQQLGERVDLYIDSGTAPIGAPSTVIDATIKPFKIIRVGAIDPEVLESLY